MRTFFLNLFSNLPPVWKNNFRKALFQFTELKFRKVTWKLNYWTLMLIEWTLLNEFETPIKKGDFRCKTTHKLRSKQTPAAVNSLKAVEIVLSKIWKLYRAPAPLRMDSPTEYFLCLINPLTHFKLVLHLCWNQLVSLHAEYPNLLAINLAKMENVDFPNWSDVRYLIKGSCSGAFYTKLAPCLVWCWYIFCRLRYVFYLSCDPAKPLRWDAMHNYGWELFVACHHPEDFSDHKHSDSDRKNASSKTWIL